MIKYILITLFWLFFLWTSYAWIYPTKEVSKPTANCKFNLWENLWSDCKIPLPVLKLSDYKKKLNDMNYRRIYTVLWASTYKYWWDKMNWTHLWIDIATSKWTPVYTIWDGKVIFVWQQSWRWKVIVIQHKFKWKYLYSNYAHLSKIIVENWQNVKEWDKIWEVWSTWYSFWNHLHFQIDKTQTIWHHPFWFKTNCTNWKDILSIWNWKECLSELIENTVDPLEFLATNWANIDFQINKIQQETIIKQEKIERKWMKSLEEIQKELIKEFVKTHNFSFSFEKAWVYDLWEYGHFTISLKDYRGRTYNDILPWDLNIIYDTNYFSAVSPRTLKILNETRKVSFKTKKTWITFFTIKMWDFVIYQKSIRILKKWTYLQPFHANIMALSTKKHIWQDYWWINIFQDKWYMNIIKVPFSWTYTIYWKNIKFCKTSNNDIKQLKYFSCNAYNIVDNFNFSYDDTIHWILIFKYIWQNKWDWKIYIKDDKWNIIAESKNLYFNDVKLIDKNTPYKDDIQIACKKWLCFGILQNGYIWNNRLLNLLEKKYLLRNFLLYLWKKTNVNTSYAEKLQKITRKQFLSDLLDILWVSIKDYSDYSSKYIDIKNLDQKNLNQVKYIEKLWFLWKDNFTKYFQPDKNINIQEALYLLNFLKEKYNK